jgi:hypothetical protein
VRKVERVAAAGISTPVLSTDVPIGSNRQNDALWFQFSFCPAVACAGILCAVLAGEQIIRASTLDLFDERAEF